MKINDVELHLDLYDAQTARRYEKAVEGLQTASTAEPDAKLSENIERQCQAVFAFFDTLFGEGTSVQIFGQTQNLNLCLDAIEKVAACVNEQKQAFLKKAGSAMHLSGGEQ